MMKTGERETKLKVIEVTCWNKALTVMEMRENEVTGSRLRRGVRTPWPWPYSWTNVVCICCEAII